ncbi:DUF3800 domain-containing protein [Nocardioides aquaticus]|uniref:DUF3800 domain-containing protein n=1 Tax=Nocardioides aquaticus TaxID=160826 RepID=UPI001BD3AE8F|nr:DUF3800 domain-containing protein [Nocardioides aquaticus]
MAFFDETGAIASDRFFVVGMLRIEDHSALLKEVKALRSRHKYREEFKFWSITEANKQAYKDLIDLLLNSEARFSCFVADRHVADPVARFGNTFAAYEKLTIQLAHGSIKPYELMTVIADNYSAPNERSFEQTVKTQCNRRLKRLGVVSVVQVDSGATEGLQLVDILVGAVGSEFRANAGLASHVAHKAEVAAHLRARLGTSTFNLGFVKNGFSVAIYEHEEWLRRAQKRLANSSRTVEPPNRAAEPDEPKPRKTRRGRRGGRRRRGGRPTGTA